MKMEHGKSGFRHTKHTNISEKAEDRVSVPIGPLIGNGGNRKVTRLMTSRDSERLRSCITRFPATARHVVHKLSTYVTMSPTSAQSGWILILSPTWDSFWFRLGYRWCVSTHDPHYYPIWVHPSTSAHVVLVSSPCGLQKPIRDP